MAPGSTVYAATAPTDVQQAAIEIDEAEGVAIGPAEWSGPSIDAGSKAADSGHTHRGLVPITITAPRGTGDIQVSGRDRFLACTPTTCLLPGSTPFEFVLEEGRFVRPAPQ